MNREEDSGSGKVQRLPLSDLQQEVTIT
jgi:hypothetical protein